MRLRLEHVARKGLSDSATATICATLLCDIGMVNEMDQTMTLSSSFGGASLPRQMEGPRPRVYPFTTLATKRLGSDADCKGLQPASCFVIQNH